MPGDLSTIAQSFASVLVENAAAREAIFAAMHPRNDQRVLQVIEQYTGGGASVTASELPEFLSLLRVALQGAASSGKTDVAGSVFGGDEDDGSGGNVFAGDEGGGSAGNVFGGDEGEPEP